MSDRYKEILRELQEKSASISRKDKNVFYREIINDIFIEKMGYNGGSSWKNEDECFFKKEGIIIQGSVEEEYEREISVFFDRLEEEGCPWGIFLHPRGIWLLNSEIRQGTDDSFRNKRIVLEIIYGLNTDQKYFSYFSFENTVGRRKNACFFRDIISYRNNEYKGNEKSWFAYHSALKRFFNFYSQYKGNYREGIYNKIGYPLFVEFIRDKTKCKSLSSAKNSFFYIRGFMQVYSDRDDFDNPDKLKDSFPDLLPKNEMQNIMNREKLKAALSFLGKGKNGTRNIAILLFFLAYGLERRKVCSLKWENIFMEKRKMIIGKKEYPMPNCLLEVLSKLPGDKKKYIFCNNNGKVLSDGAINTILSDIAKLDPKDKFYSQLTPGNIRRSLASFLLENGYPLHKIFYLMDIEGYKLENYITNEEIEKAAREDRKDLDCPIDTHPMEKFFENII